MRSRSSYRKPVGDVRLIKNHPLSHLLTGGYLFNDGGGAVFKNRGIYGPVHSITIPGTLTNLTGVLDSGSKPCDLGVGIRTNGLNDLSAANPSSAYQTSVAATPGWSLAVKFRLPSLPSGFSGIVSIGITSTESEPVYLLQCNGSTEIRVLIGNVAFITVIPTPVTDTWYTVVSTVDGVLTNNVTVTEQHYLGSGRSAAQIYSGSLTTAANTKGNTLFLGKGYNTSQAMDCEYLYIWDRRLTYREALDVILDPYQMWECGNIRRLSGGGSVVYPSPNDVRQGIVFGPPLPNPNDVRLGVVYG